MAGAEHRIDFRTVWLLAKVPLLSMFNINDVRHGKTSADRAKAVLILVLIGFAIIEFSFFVGLATFGLLNSGAAQGQDIALFTLLFFGASIGALLASAYTASSGLFRFKDYDQTAVLPVSTREIVLSRVTLTLLYDGIFALVILLPAALVYQFSQWPEWWFWPTFLVVAPVSLLLPYSAGVGIGYLSTRVSWASRFGAIWSAALTGAVLLGFMWLINSASSGELSVEIITSIARDLTAYYPPALWAGRAVIMGTVLDLALFLTASGAIFYIMLTGVARVFQATNSTSQPKVRPSSKASVTGLRIQPAFTALLGKEWKRLTSSTLYMLNTMFGLGAMVVGSVAVLFTSPEGLADMLEMPGLPELLGSVAPIALAVAIATVGISASSISLEGSHFWILRAAPVGSLTILHAKAALNVLVTVPPILIAAAALAFTFELSGVYVLLMVITPLLMAAVVSLGGLLLNLAFPKMEWQTEVVVIKQSIPVLLALVGGITLGVGPLALSQQLPLTPLELTVATTAVYALVAAMLYYLLATWGTKKFENI